MNAKALTSILFASLSALSVAVSLSSAAEAKPILVGLKRRKLRFGAI